MWKCEDCFNIYKFLLCKKGLIQRDLISNPDFVIQPHTFHIVL